MGITIVRVSVKEEGGVQNKRATKIAALLIGVILYSYFTTLKVSVPFSVVTTTI